MPNNYPDRKSELEAKYNHVLWGKEYKSTHLIAAIADIYFTGGQLTLAKIESDAKELGLDVACWLLKHGVSNKDTFYAGNITISHWESPFLPLSKKKVSLPNSFRLYIAVNKTHKEEDEKTIAQGSVQGISYDPSQEQVIGFFGAHGKYICCEPNGHVVCDRKVLGPWEKFRSIPVGDNEVALQSSHGKYLSAQQNGAMEGNRSDIGDWEKFKVCEQEKGMFALKSCHGKYLCAQQDGGLKIDADHCQGWEKFVVCSS